MFRWKVLNWNEKGNAKPTELNKKCQRFVQWKRRKFQIRPKRNNNSHIQCFKNKKNIVITSLKMELEDHIQELLKLML